ncbi:MAG TPA: universal stress protein [Desulfosarcina sp.]|nr:universal stress protein [Desulfosarcina sp.]
MKFLVAYNGSGESKAALDLAIGHAATFDAKVYVITSMEGGHSEKPEDIARVNRELKQVRLKLEARGVDHEVHETVRGLSPGEDIVNFALENGVDQIFVGIEKKSRTRKLLLGSTAQYIILKASCPVTTIKQPAA